MRFTIKNLVPITYTANLQLMVGLIVIIALTFSIYIFSENKIDKANNLRYQSQLLVDELRQSSDDSTLMVRTYLATGNPIYKKYYQKILDIRNGKLPRPNHYNNVYWDFVLSDEKSPDIDTTQANSLLDLMKQANLPEHELQKLTQAKLYLDELAKIEFNAIKMRDTSATHDSAILMLHSNHYYHAKASLIKSINEAISMMDKRTFYVVHHAKVIAVNMQIMLIGLLLGLIVILSRLYNIIKDQLGGSLSEISLEIARIGNADYTRIINISAGKENSVLNWLAKTQSNLIEMEFLRKQTETLLRDSEERLALATISNGFGVWDLNLQTMKLVWDESMFNLYQIKREEFSNDVDAWEKSLHHDDRQRFEKELQAAIDNIKPFDTEFRIVQLNSEIRYIKAVAKVFFNDDGVPLRVIGTNVDISERVLNERMQSELVNKELSIAATAFEIQEGMYITDANFVVLRTNQAFTKITGYSSEESIGQTPRLFNATKKSKAIYAAMRKSIETKGIWESEIQNQRKNGEIYPEHLTITSVKDVNGIISNYVATITDNSASKEALDEINNLAFYDPLTQLPNRRMLFDRLNQALATGARIDKSGALLFLDLDQFKILNDTLGHEIGDLLLKQVASRLISCVRKGDTVARLGGDEFVVLLEGLSEHAIEAAAQTKNIAEKIITALNKPYQLNLHSHHNTASIGATLFNGHDEVLDELLKQADIAMYQSKTAGRNTLRFFDLKMQESLNARAEMEHDLRKAIEQQLFQLHYQIQVDSTGKALGAEALIRWQHPDRGMISPYHFISLAEETGLILPIGKWVLDTACAQLKAWQQAPLTKDLELSINVSAKQLLQVDFVKQVKATLKRYDIRPTQLKLELTESMLIKNINEIIIKMKELSKIGIRFSLDDFGTGYSSLQYLKILPLNQLKIDQSFVRDISNGINNRAIVCTIITMAHSLGLNVIAEGVETTEQRQFLLDNGCSNFQGYLFSKPVPIDAFEALLREI